MKELAVYFKYIRMNYLCGLQYKGWPFMILQTFFVVIADPIELVFLFLRFGNIGQWSMEKIILIYAMAVTGYGMAETLCRGFDYFPFHMIRNGKFDRVLLRPRSLPLQIAGSYFHLHRIPRVVTGIGVITWSLWKQGIVISPGRVLMLICAILGGFITYIGVFIFTSGLAFFTIQGLDWIYIFTNTSYQLTRCPVEYLPKILKYAFTFLLPVMVISYYPASAICGWGEAAWKGWLSLPAGLLFLGASNFVWRFGVRHYKSTGS